MRSIVGGESNDDDDDDDVWRRRGRRDQHRIFDETIASGKLGYGCCRHLFIPRLQMDASLTVPHVDCESIQDIDWFKLKQAGFTAVIFDKDNTLTIPYATDVYPPLLESVKECTQAFGNERVCVYSNSAGLEQYDPNGMEAKHLEKELGIRVARHKEKKPSGSGAELAKFLNNDSHSKKESSNSRGETNSPCEKFVFVGDRYLTDVVFGNKSGMFTIRVAPFDVSNESKP